jgi:hypothetical protein
MAMPQRQNTKAKSGSSTPPRLAALGDIVDGAVLVLRPTRQGGVEPAVVAVVIPVDDELDAVEREFLRHLTAAIPALRQDQVRRDRFLHAGKGLCRPDGVFWAWHVTARRWIWAGIADVKPGSA